LSNENISIGFSLVENNLARIAFMKNKWTFWKNMRENIGKIPTLYAFIKK